MVDCRTRLHADERGRIQRGRQENLAVTVGGTHGEQACEGAHVARQRQPGSTTSARRNIEITCAAKSVGEGLVRRRPRVDDDISARGNRDGARAKGRCRGGGGVGVERACEHVDAPCPAIRHTVQAEDTRSGFGERTG